MTDTTQALSRDKARRFRVAVAKTVAERQRVYAFRYRILVDEMGLELPGIDHRRGLIEDPLDASALQICLFVDSQIEASLRLLVGTPRELPDELRQVYRIDTFDPFAPDGLSFTDRLLVAESWRASQVPQVLVGAAYKIARGYGVSFDFCHCPPALIGLYQKLGYRAFAGNYTDPVYGLQSAMVLVMSDTDHLFEMNSPFAPLSRQFDPDPEAVGWFKRALPDVAADTGKRLRDERNFWEYLTSRLHQTPLIGIPLLRDLSYTEAMKFLKEATILTCDLDERLAREGDIGREMFVLLSGAVDVRIGKGRKARTVASFSRGAVLGEIAFLSATRRTADLVITESAEVLVLTQDFLQRVMDKMPKVAARVLFNLSLVLCDRLADSNRNLIEPDGTIDLEVNTAAAQKRPAA